MKPLVSIIMPTFNRAHVLQRAIDSVLKQTVREWELFIIDSYSDDDTDAIVTKNADSRINLLKIEIRRNIAASRNKGIQAATGYYIAFLDTDDCWSPHKLQISLMNLKKGADLVYHSLQLERQGRNPFFRKKLSTRKLSSPVFRDLLINGNCIPNSSVVVKRELISKVGGLSEDPTLLSWEDYDLWLRLSQFTEKFVRLDEALGYYWESKDSITQPKRTITNQLRFKELYLDKDSETSLKLPNRFHYSLAKSYFQVQAYREAAEHAKKAVGPGLGFKESSKVIIVLILSLFLRK